MILRQNYPICYSHLVRIPVVAQGESSQFRTAADLVSSQSRWRLHPLIVSTSLQPIDSVRLTGGKSPIRVNP